MTFARSQAVLSRSRVVGDEHRKRGICTFDETGKATILNLSRAITDVLE
jgi:hypothetical protein